MTDVILKINVDNSRTPIDLQTIERSFHNIYNTPTLKKPFKWCSCCSIFSFLCSVSWIVVCPFVFFLFGYWVVCSSLIYGFFLLLWCHQTFRFNRKCLKLHNSPFRRNMENSWQCTCKLTCLLMTKQDLKQRGWSNKSVGHINIFL